MGAPEEPSRTARELWLAVEPIHAVIYFVPDVYDALADAGTKGFWMGYFGHRAAPMGAVSAGVVQATFFNFAPARVQRAVPDVWDHVRPDELCRVRREASARLLARLTAELPDTTVADAVEHLEAVAAAADTAGRPLAAANQQLAPVRDLHERLWQATTTIREHRGDGHVAVLVSHDIGSISLNPDTRAAFLDVFRWLTPLVRAEGGCIEYQGTIDVPTTIAVQEGPRDDVVVVVEKWESVEALYAHTTAEHMTDYRAKVKDYVRGVSLQVTEPI